MLEIQCCWITDVINICVKDIQDDESNKLLSPCQAASSIPWCLKGGTLAGYSRFVSVPVDVIDALRLFYDDEFIFPVFEFIGK